MPTPLDEDADPDSFTRRARPTFLYIMYVLLLTAIPVGLLATVRPAAALAIAAAMRAYFAAIPEPLYALFGTGYLGYTVAREWGKAKGAR
ncbi:3TM-type holin [Sphingomonas sp. BIUV-7]|uniref:3TM-type holin n=1 Tax=Sphingomonas natans TaxID=3063330 RepID=A0ABT8YFR9_9SPHN|nr:3TM-type holin [Sphingomonas sp. BIUV-7]MDO6416758.1 3TM-type holin [Sphingomonas sp. BIUV-7]